MKKFITVAILIAIAIWVVNISLKRTERNECEQWKKDAQNFTGYYLTDWQKKQCDSFGIKVEIPAQDIKQEIGTAASIRQFAKISWYNYDLPGNKKWSIDHRTAAARDWPRGTILKVCRQDEPEKCVEVLVNDYGPDPDIFPDRALDISSYAFGKLFPLSQGVGIVIISEVK